MLLGLLGTTGKGGGGTPPYVFPYNPVIDYKWNTSFAGNFFGGESLMVNSGSSGVDGKNYFGQSVKFNGIDQSIIVDINAQVQTVAFIVDGTQWYDEVTTQMTDYTINTPTSNFIRSNYIFYDGIFTTAQKDFLKEKPERFLYINNNILNSEILTQSEIDNVVAYFPMCELGNTITDLVSTATYPIINYTSSCRLSARTLNYGLQTGNIVRSPQGVPIRPSFEALECDNSGYIDTQWIPSGEFTLEVVYRVQKDSTETTVVYCKEQADYILALHRVM
ncbi:MAG: hypothetical protein L3I99_02010 [Sulfurimonas sp.]|nr:hypothetical protein [Sulfurimonas sp.]